MPVPVITVAQMREWEDLSWTLGRKVADVMRRAGAAVAQTLQEISRRGEHLLFLAGRGNNGNDTRLAAEMVRGRPVEIIDIDDPEVALPAISEALERSPGWVVDGVFGIGLNRPLEGAWSELVASVNDSSRPVLAVDVPSGLNADTGELMGGAIQARETVTFGAPKVGLLSDSAAEWIGHLHVAHDIGLVDCPFKGDLQWVLSGDFQGFPLPRAVNTHKGNYGHLGILAGSAGYHGAAVLAARGALRAMPGLVSVVTLKEAYVPVASQLQAAMVHTWPTKVKCDGWLVGPGLATDEALASLREEAVDLWQRFPGPVVVDASALEWLPDGPAASDALRVITPHPGEAARMLNSDTTAVQADRPAALRELARRKGGCFVVLKGRHTLCGSASDVVSINSTGNPGLAQGGSGDVLAGLVAGLVVQPSVRADVDRALRWSVWRQGMAADRLMALRRAWTSEDLVKAI